MRNFAQFYELLTTAFHWMCAAGSIGFVVAACFAVFR